MSPLICLRLCCISIVAFKVKTLIGLLLGRINGFGLYIIGYKHKTFNHAQGF
jgi:hypothetical protein